MPKSMASLPAAIDDNANAVARFSRVPIEFGITPAEPSQFFSDASVAEIASTGITAEPSKNVLPTQPGLPEMGRSVKSTVSSRIQAEIEGDLSPSSDKVVAAITELCSRCPSSAFHEKGLSPSTTMNEVYVSTAVSHVSCSSPAHAGPSPLTAQFVAPPTAAIDATAPAAPSIMVRPFQLLSSDLQVARVRPAMQPRLRQPTRRFSAPASTGTCFSAPSVCDPNLVTTVHDHDAKTFQCALCLDLSFAAFAALRRHRTTTHAGTAFADAYRPSCGCDESFTTRLLALRHSTACAPPAAPTPSPLRPFVPHAVRAAFPAVPALTAALAEVAADEECTNQNNTTLAVAPPLASRFAASGAGIPPQPCVSTLVVDHAVPTASPARPLLSVPLVVHLPERASLVRRVAVNR
ncbi:hypothetical protein DYB36_003500 [Aphanomyces astaci]|uniref:Uncharacterized protein n=1 Tax=Aphanomyces astaci TaxID=112090 RepID=A0A397AFB0_APHAT|nr:hypothetical protein DYB36_003500 [Aphanomyces astaci]